MIKKGMTLEEEQIAPWLMGGPRDKLLLIQCNTLVSPTGRNTGGVMTVKEERMK